MMNNQEFRNYLAAGIVCNTLWPGMKEPTLVAYLYNGVRLPTLPDTYPGTYAEAAIRRVSSSKIYVLILTAKFGAVNGPTSELRFETPSAIYTCPIDPSDDDTWTLLNVDVYSYPVTYTGLWSSVEIEYKESATSSHIWAPVSNPIPVYE